MPAASLSYRRVLRIGGSMPKHHGSTETVEKTNAMRILDAAGVSYRVHPYEENQSLTGVEVARLIGHDPDSFFKTLVTRAKDGSCFVFMVPVACELDLKKAVRAAGEKSLSMLKARDLLPTTGYVHGGCSPIGMKKAFPTFIDETAELYDVIACSAGRIGCAMDIRFDDLRRMTGVSAYDITA